MKRLLALVLISMLTFLSSGFGPWWIIAILAFGVVIGMRLRTGAGFLVGFAGVFLAWAVYAGWIDAQNNSVLSARVGALFGALSPVLMILLTGLIGGLVGGLAGMTGALAARMTGRSEQEVTVS